MNLKTLTSLCKDNLIIYETQNDRINKMSRDDYYLQHEIHIRKEKHIVYKIEMQLFELGLWKYFREIYKAILYMN